MALGPELWQRSASDWEQNKLAAILLLPKDSSDAPSHLTRGTHCASLINLPSHSCHLATVALHCSAEAAFTSTPAPVLSNPLNHFDANEFNNS